MKKRIYSAIAGCTLFALAVSRTSATPTSSVSTETNNISDISGWALVAEARSGSNGNDNLPDPDFDLVDPSGDGDGGYITWDTDLADGFCAGPVTAELIVDLASGSATYTITDADNNVHTAYYSGVSGTIAKVVLRSAVETPGVSCWNSPTVDFYKNNNLVETWNACDQTPTVDTTSTSYSVAAQSLTITPSSSDNTKIDVLAQFDCETSDTAPGPNDLFGQIFVFKN